MIVYSYGGDVDLSSSARCDMPNAEPSTAASSVCEGGSEGGR